MADRIAWGLLTAVLVVAAITDWRTGKVYNWLSFPAILFGLAFWVVAGFAEGGKAGAQSRLTAALIGLAAGLLPAAAIVGMGGMGGGDAKLLGVIGALSGNWRCVLGTWVYGLLLSTIIIVVVMIRRGLVRKTLHRIVGALLSIFTRVPPEFAKDSPRIPVAIPFAIGGILAGMEWLLHLNMPWGRP